MARPPWIKLEQLQYPKDDGGLAPPKPWLYNVAAQLQHLMGSLVSSADPDLPALSFTAQVLLTLRHRNSMLEGLESLVFSKTN